MDLSEVNCDMKHRHPWELSRSESILSLVIDKIKDTTQVVDVGSGDLFFIQHLALLTLRPVIAIDSHFTDLNPQNNIIKKKSVKDLHPEFADILFLLDVLEHVENDFEFFSQIVASLKNGGEIIVTVPAHQFLFGDHDIFLKHFRRYEKNQLIKLIESNNLKVSEAFYFYTSLVGIRLLQKIFFSLFKKKNFRSISNWKYPTTHWTTKTIKTFLNWDFKWNHFLSRLGINLGGLSICVIAEKKFVS